MTNYRRAALPGATYFFTVNLAERRSTLLTDRIDDLRAAVRYTRQRHPFAIDAMTILPDHLHAVWTLPPDDADFPLRWRLIKTYFSRHMPQGEHHPAASQKASEASGNVGIGNTWFAAKKTFGAAWSTPTSTR